MLLNRKLKPALLLSGNVFFYCGRFPAVGVHSRFITKTRGFFANALHNIKRITHD